VARDAVEREFGKLKHDWALRPRLKLRADLTILTQLACALAKEPTMPLAA
jgi:hypothetical protein